MSDINISAFNNSSILKKITYSIDDKPLGVEDIVTAEIHWNKNHFAISGSIIIKDNIDAANLLPLNSKNVLEIYAEDGFDEFYFRKFIIADAKEMKRQGKHKALEFKFVDILTFTMMNTFIGKSYKDKKLSEIFSDFYEKYNWDQLLDTHVALEVVETEVVHDYIVIPQNKNFLEWYKAELEKEGLTMYQTRKEVRIGVKKEDLIPTKLEKIPHSYSQLHYLAEHPFRIHEHTTDFNPVGTQSQEVPLRASHAFDFLTKSMPTTQVALEEVFDGIKTATSAFNDIQPTIGEKLYSGTTRNQGLVKTQTQDTFLQNSQLTILVVANFKYNKIYHNADVVLTGSLEHIQGQNEGDVTMSGVYTILSIVDRIVSGRCFQKITLARADFQENKV